MAAAREDQLAGFIALLKDEHRHRVLGLDCGTGAVGLAFVRAGLHFTGVDASADNIHAARARGLDASVAESSALPFRDSAFDAVWAADALTGRAPEQQAVVLRELERVSDAGAPIGIVRPDPADAGALSVFRSGDMG